MAPTYYLPQLTGSVVEGGELVVDVEEELVGDEALEPMVVVVEVLKLP